MAMTSLVFLIMVIFFYAPLIYVFILIIRALRKYLKSSDIRKEKTKRRYLWEKHLRPIEPIAK